VLAADRLAGRFVAFVLVLAAITAALWLRLDADAALDHVIALLVVACPCALGLATPMALAASLGRAARAGILIKGGDALEALAERGRVWLDKTGTLTEGRLTLVRWEGDDEALALAAALEAGSGHPIARALAAAADAPKAEVVEARELPGEGRVGRVGHHTVLVGSPAFVGSELGGIADGWKERIEELADRGITPVVVAIDGALAGVAGLADPLRSDAAAALGRLCELGWRAGVLSGDHDRVAARVGEELGLAATEVHGEASPEDKLARVSADEVRPVVMVGDGINDAAALAAADVGVAVSGGAEAALVAADVYLGRRDLAGLVELFEGARRTRSIIRRNLVFSLIYNVVGVGLALGGFIGPLAAAVLMPLSSVTVVTSSLVGRSFRPLPARDPAVTPSTASPGRVGASR
jgi:Cu2+-exporting ATPase